MGGLLAMSEREQQTDSRQTHCFVMCIGGGRSTHFLKAPPTVVMANSKDIEDQCAALPLCRRRTLCICFVDGMGLLC